MRSDARFLDEEIADVRSDRLAWEQQFLEEHGERMLAVATRFIEAPEPEPKPAQRHELDASYDRGRRTNMNWREATWPYPKPELEDSDGDPTHAGVPT